MYSGWLDYSRRASILDFNVYIGRISRYMEKRYISRSEIRSLEVSVSKEVINNLKRRIWRRR